MSTETAKTEKPKDPNVFVLKDVRLSFPHLFKASAMKDSEPKFGAVALMDKEKHKATIAAIQKRIGELVVEVCKVRTLGADKICLRDGDEKSDKEGYEGNMYLSASNSKKPQVLSQDRSVMDSDDPRMFAGVYVNMVVRLWAQNNDFGKRVNASLEIVQYLRKGEAFGAAPLVAEEFLDVEVEEEGGGLL